MEAEGSQRVGGKGAGERLQRSEVLVNLMAFRAEPVGSPPRLRGLVLLETLDEDADAGRAEICCLN